MRRAYKFLLRPTTRQAASLAACLDDHRSLYNSALEERREAWRRSRVTIRYGDQSAQLRDIRRADPDHARWSFSSQQATLRRLDKAFTAFFRRIKAGQTPGYPRFKGPGWFDTVEWPKDRDGCRWNPAPGSDRVRVYLQGIGHVRVHAHRQVEGTVKTISVKRQGRRWHVILSCDEVSAQPLAATGRVVGVDMGVVSFLTTSDGVHVANPRHLAASRARLTDAQRALARHRPGSIRRRKTRERVAALHGRIGRQRLDHAHKIARWLVGHHDLIAHEDLCITNMTGSTHGTVNAPATNVAQKSGLNRSILDAGWGVFLRVLAAKAESAGRLVIAVNPANTSRTCPQCGHCARENRLTQAEFACVACGHTGHADVVGASNILRAGLALQAARAA
ncbi:RNA-guided endonuclease InsQ/TnpB family protein [Micromonospora sp. CA-259024]|uniref:RNA-guided endonuclease InsQ/TnpB family protein n=1 Tax=Micromonospora sp. CA-259024 TaxID=3239965 RepID=UPI003D8C40F5